MAIRISYFARIREAIGVDDEEVDLPAGVDTVAALVDWLTRRGGGYAEALADRGRLRAAVDDVIVGMEASIAGAREVALFPPVTGGGA